MGKKPKCTKAVAYIRASTGRQELSPGVQRERIEAYCKMAGLELVDVIVEHVSAKIKLSKRPEGKRIAKLVENGVCHVVALKLDRLFRSAIDALATVDEWQKAGIALHLVDMNGMSMDSGSSMGRMFLTLLAAFAEFERNCISERTSAALRHMKTHGKVYNHAPFGYVVEDGNLLPDAAEQAVIAKMAALRELGVSYSRIADALNSEGVPTKLNGTWGSQTISNILALAAR